MGPLCISKTSLLSIPIKFVIQLHSMVNHNQSPALEDMSPYCHNIWFRAQLEFLMRFLSMVMP
eukprot:12281623-Karenia_brevis.AAC.1